jgi:hypothetical protein
VVLPQTVAGLAARGVREGPRASREEYLTRKRGSEMDVEKMRFQTPEGRESYMNARAIAEQCAKEVSADYQLEDIFWGSYPPSWDELLAACGEDEDAGSSHIELENAVRNPTDDKATHDNNFLDLDFSYGNRLAAHIEALALFGHALNERQRREHRQLTAEDLARALLSTEGKFQSAQDRAVAILKG